MNWNDLQRFIDPLWIKWITGIVGSGGSALLGAFLQRIKIRSPLKRLWKFHDVHTTTVCISESFQSQETMRQYTGIGQVKAFGLIVESIGRAYSLQMKNIFFSKDDLQDRIEKDLVIIGGPVTNKRAANFLERIKPLGIIESENNAFIWKKESEPKRYESRQEGNTTIEYGLIVRMPNPFDTNKQSTLSLFAGCHSGGTIAAAKYFTTYYKKKYSFWQWIRGYDPKTVFIIVECRIDHKSDYPYDFVQKHIYEE